MLQVGGGNSTNCRNQPRLRLARFWKSCKHDEHILANLELFPSAKLESPLCCSRSQFSRHSWSNCAIQTLPPSCRTSIEDCNIGFGVVARWRKICSQKTWSL